MANGNDIDKYLFYDDYHIFPDGAWAELVDEVCLPLQCSILRRICIMSRHVLSCHVRSCHMMSRYVMSRTVTCLMLGATHHTIAASLSSPLLFRNLRVSCAVHS